MTTKNQAQRLRAKKFLLEKMKKELPNKKSEK